MMVMMMLMLVLMMMSRIGAGAYLRIPAPCRGLRHDLTWLLWPRCIVLVHDIAHAAFCCCIGNTAFITAAHIGQKLELDSIALDAIPILVHVPGRVFHKRRMMLLAKIAQASIKLWTSSC